MQKQAPSIGRILVAAGFALSCFGLILFLWIAFGGPIPLKPESYRITAYFPEATQLAQESDVRIGGVSVGKVKTIELAPESARVNGKDTTKAEIEIDPEFAPISEDARAILRQKTLLGETYVELTSGTEPGEDSAPVSLGAAANVSDAEAEGIESVEEGGTLGVGQTEEATQIDEIFNALDEETRTSFQRWQQNAAIAIQGRGLDLNDSLGNLGPFITDASNVVEILNRQKQALKGLVRDTGTVFEALTAQDQALAGAIVGSENTFEALAREERALAESFQIFPTFERESRLTFERLDEFQADTHPLVRDLIPVARDLSPTLRSVRRLSPDLRKLFVKLGKLETASEDGLPALERTLDGLAPVFDALDPFLANLNPALRYLEFQKLTMTDFMAGPGVALSGALDKFSGDPAPRHYLRQIGYLGSESLSLHPNRLATNRGNGYNAPGALNSPLATERGMYASFDCKNPDYAPIAGGDPDEDIILSGQTLPDVHGGQPPDAHFAPCWIQGDFPASPFGSFGDGRAPNVFPDP
jgi:phospholipid/cholesterol/gamma-HCH transport system substrate-binding protein